MRPKLRLESCLFVVAHSINSVHYRSCSCTGGTVERNVNTKSHTPNPPEKQVNTAHRSLICKEHTRSGGTMMITAHDFVLLPHSCPFHVWDDSELAHVTQRVRKFVYISQVGLRMFGLCHDRLCSGGEEEDWVTGGGSGWCFQFPEGWWLYTSMTQLVIAVAGLWITCGWVIQLTGGLNRQSSCAHVNASLLSASWALLPP